MSIELPKPGLEVLRVPLKGNYYTADQVEQIRQEAARLAMERCAKVAEESHPDDWAFIGSAIRSLLGTATAGAK